MEEESFLLPKNEGEDIANKVEMSPPPLTISFDEILTDIGLGWY